MGLFRKKKHEQVRQSHISDHNDDYAFRRSRTMTGSLSSSVKAAAETRADLQSDRIKHHNLKTKRRRISLYLLGTVLLLVAISTLINQFTLSTFMMRIKDVPENETSSYHKSVDEYLASHPNERFAFSLRRDALTGFVQEKFPEVRSVSLSVQSWLQPSDITISLRQPIASWTIGETKYYIDDRGVAFQKNYSGEPALVVEDRTGIDPSSTGAVASERMIRYIGRLVAILSQSGFVVEKIELPPATSREVDVKLAGRSYVVKTSLDRDPAGQVADVVNAIKYLDQKKISPSYADVRVSSRLYYK